MAHENSFYKDKSGKACGLKPIPFGSYFEYPDSENVMLIKVNGETIGNYRLWNSLDEMIQASRSAKLRLIPVAS